jgi:hypothetical protein
MNQKQQQETKQMQSLMKNKLGESVGEGSSLKNLLKMRFKHGLNPVPRTHTIFPVEYENADQVCVTRLIFFLLLKFNSIFTHHFNIIFYIKL